MTSNLTSIPYSLITSDAQLQQAASEWEQHACIALDTEFMRVNTFYPRAALFQIGAGGQCFLVDPLSIEDFSPLRRLLENTDTVKVMHACSEDLEVFKSFLECTPAAIFDTQIGAAFLGHGLSVGYKNLVDGLFDVDLPKGEQRSDWLQRPLSDQQLVYAAQDVTYLIDIYQQQIQQLDEKGWLGWAREEIAALLDKQQQTMEPTEAYLKVKGAGRLNHDEVQVLHALSQWREIEARSRNIPRGFLLKDQQLLEISQRQPTTPGGLSSIEEMRHRVIRQDGETIINLVSNSVNGEAKVPAFPEPLPPRAKPLIKELQSLLSRVAHSHGLDAQLLLNRKTLVAMLTQLMNYGVAELPSDLPAWKQALFGDDLVKLLASMKGKF